VERSSRHLPCIADGLTAHVIVTPTDMKHHIFRYCEMVGSAREIRAQSWAGGENEASIGWAEIYWLELKSRDDHTPLL